MEQGFGRETHLILAGLDRELIDLFKQHDVLLCGGALTSVFSSARIRDWDLYFTSRDAAVAVREEFIKNGKECSSTDLARTYTWKKKKRPFQLIEGVGYFPDDTDGDASLAYAKKVFDHYDYTICMGGYSFKHDAFFFDDLFFKHLAQRRLVFNHKTDFPLCSLVRAAKYVKRGYTISGVEQLKLALTVNNLSIKTYKSLRDQMLGIDTMFLTPLTDLFKSPGMAERPHQLDETLQYIDEYLKKSSWCEDDETDED